MERGMKNMSYVSLVDETGASGESRPNHTHTYDDNPGQPEMNVDIVEYAEGPGGYIECRVKWAGFNGPYFILFSGVGRGLTSQKSSPPPPPPRFFFFKFFYIFFFCWCSHFWFFLFV